MIRNNSILPVNDIVYTDNTSSTALDAFISALNFGKAVYQLPESKDTITKSYIEGENPLDEYPDL